MTRSFTRELGDALVQELATIIGSMLDGAADLGPGAQRGGPHWVAQIDVGGRAAGACTVAIDAPSAEAITSVVMGLDGPAAPEAVIDTFRELCSQAVAALSVKPMVRGATLGLSKFDSTPDLQPGNEPAVFALASAKLPAPVAITVWGDVRQLPEAPAGPRPIAEAPDPLPLGTSLASAPSRDDRIDVILDIDLPLTVRFGRTEMPLKSLARLGPGSVIDLGRSPDDPVDVLVSNRVVARGEVVIVSGSYGVRILDVVSPRDRAPSLED